MEAIASRHLRAKALKQTLVDFVEMIPTVERRRLLNTIYESYRRQSETLWNHRGRPSDKSALCENIMNVLSDSAFLTRIEDRSSVQYKLNTIRLREYIRGRNRRLKADLLWACLFVGLDQENTSSSQEVRTKIFELVRNLEERLTRAKQSLQEGYRPEASDEDISRILDKGCSELKEQADMADFLVKYKKLEIAAPRLTEAAHSKILNALETRKSRPPLKGSLLESEAVRKNVVERVEQELVDKTRIKYDDLLCCAKGALQKVRSLGACSGSKILQAYEVSVRRLIRNRRTVRITPYADKVIDRTIEEVLTKAGQRI